MKVQYLGTGGAEGFPGLFCECQACRKARLHGSYNIKTRSCTLINDIVLVDLSPDIYYQAIANQVSLSKVKSVVFTHSHLDHLDLFSLNLRGRDSASIIPTLIEQANYINIYGSEKVVNDIDKMINNEKRVNIDRFRIKSIEKLTKFTCEGMMFYPIKVVHDPFESCFIYAIHDGMNWFLLANDSGLFSEEVYQQMGKISPCFDAVSLDCARGNLPGDGHMGLAENITVRNELIARGFVKQNAKYYLNHFSHMCGMIHEEMQELASQHDFQMTYDGMILEI